MVVLPFGVGMVWFITETICGQAGAYDWIQKNWGRGTAAEENRRKNGKKRRKLLRCDK
jgi:hypothetical protein